MSTYDFLTAKRQAEQEARAYAILSGGTSPGKAAVLRRAVEQAAAALSDEEAAKAAELFALWCPDSAAYTSGTRVRFEGALYRCLQDHSSQPAWTPTAAASLWSRVLIPNQNLITEWTQPDSTNAYARGDKVSHNGTLWVSDIDSNIWEPGLFGWSPIQ